MASAIPVPRNCVSFIPGHSGMENVLYFWAPGKQVDSLVEYTICIWPNSVLRLRTNN